VQLLQIYIFCEIFQTLDMCQLGDEVRKKEGKLDSTGLTTLINLLIIFLNGCEYNLYVT
jgi:hypothetical protein